MVLLGFLLIFFDGVSTMATSTKMSAVHSFEMIDRAIACFTKHIEKLDAEKESGVEIDRYLHDDLVDARGFARDAKNAAKNAEYDDYNTKLVECALACNDLQVYLEDTSVVVDTMHVYKLKAAIAAIRHAIVDPDSLF